VGGRELFLPAYTGPHLWSLFSRAPISLILPLCAPGPQSPECNTIVFPHGGGGPPLVGSGNQPGFPPPPPFEFSKLFFTKAAFPPFEPNIPMPNYQAPLQQPVFLFSRKMPIEPRCPRVYRATLPIPFFFPSKIYLARSFFPFCLARSPLRFFIGLVKICYPRWGADLLSFSLSQVVSPAWSLSFPLLSASGNPTRFVRSLKDERAPFPL